MVLVDSSVWIDYFNGKPTVECDALDALLGTEPVVIGDLILTEVLQGFRSDADYRRARALLDPLTLCRLGGREVALAAADNYRRLRSQGVTIRKTIYCIIGSFSCCTVWNCSTPIGISTAWSGTWDYGSIAGCERFMKRCCVNCFQDAAIREFIASLAVVGACDYCGQQGVPTGDIATVGDFVRHGLDRAYADTSSVNDRDREYLCASSPTCVLEEEAGIVVTARDKDLAGDLLTAFSNGACAQDYQWLISGYDSIARHCNFFKAYGIEDANQYTSSWQDFKSRVMHNTRFFDIDESRQSLIREISALFPQMDGVLRTGERVYRARLAEDWLPYDPWEIQQDLGPPPLHCSQNNRMSPRGISYLYVSGDPETCVAEIQPNVGREVWVARFAVLTDIKLLDLAKLPVIEIPSIFSADYDDNLDWADHFLSEFLAEVSQPPSSKDDPLEYIPTQVLAEHIRAQGYQGIAYQSAQHPEGVNYTLFCSPEADPARYYRPDRPVFHEWLRIEEVNTVRVTGLRLETATTGTRAIDPTVLEEVSTRSR